MDYNNLVSKELIQYLEETFPNRLPSRECDLTELSFLQGQQSVVERLSQLYEEDHGFIPSSPET